MIYSYFKEEKIEYSINCILKAIDLSPVTLPIIDCEPIFRSFIIMLSSIINVLKSRELIGLM